MEEQQIQMEKQGNRKLNMNQILKEKEFGTNRFSKRVLRS